MVVAHTSPGQCHHRNHHLQHEVVPPNGDHARRHVRHELVVQKDRCPDHSVRWFGRHHQYAERIMTLLDVVACVVKPSEYFAEYNPY